MNGKAELINQHNVQDARDMIGVKKMTEEEKAKLDLLETKIASHDVDIEIFKKRLKKLQENISEVRDGSNTAKSEKDLSYV